MPSVLKDCAKCGRRDAEHRVFSRGALKTGLHPKCRVCELEAQTTRNVENPLRMRAYRAWTLLRGRIRNNPHYAGLPIEPTWNPTCGGSFETFLSHVGLPPTTAHSIDRLDGTKGYLAGNVRWATVYQQKRNQCNNRWIEFRGQRLVLEDWANQVGIKSGTIWRRITVGWSVEAALTTPPRQKSKSLRN